ncbi:MAG: DNA-3-methyladenine glycosylase family protein [Gemmatimonadaceae bacterium]
MPSHSASVRYLKRADPVLARVIERVGPCRLQLRTDGTHYDALIRSIVFQQLSGKAASTIHARFRALYPGDTPLPQAVLETSDDSLRSAGLSRQKIGYLRDLSKRVADDSLPLDAIHTMDDDDVIVHLVQVKGIGRWTAQMFLMFRLGRPDVLPELDLGIQNAIRRAYRMRKRPTPKQVTKVGARWSPHATVACWYLWRSLENGDGQLGAK